MRGGNPALRPVGLEEPTTCEQRPVGEREKEQQGQSNGIVLGGGLEPSAAEQSAPRQQPTAETATNEKAGSPRMHGNANAHSGDSGYVNGVMEDMIPGRGGGPNHGPGQTEKNVPELHEIPSNQVSTGGR
jgi:hypothetical protein